MCIILDSNKIGDFLNQKSDMLPIYNWIEKSNGKIVYSNHPKIEEEIHQHTEMLNFLQERSKVGQAKLISSQSVIEAITKIEKSTQKQNYKLKSDDIHIVALAKASKAKLLCSADTKLHQDFKKIIDNGQVYQNKAHKNLLKKDICP